MTSRADVPLVSVVLTTRDRPMFLDLALEYFRRQTYPHRELIVVDDGEHYPAERDAVAQRGGRLVRLESPAPLGTKLNEGLELARGTWCAKWDDDDYYGERYLETMVGEVLAQRKEVCAPLVAFLSPFLFFDVASWQVRRSPNVPGATLFFAREDWEHRPFRGTLFNNEDVWFVRDQGRTGASVLPVHRPPIFMAVRHSGAPAAHGHTWTHHGDGVPLEQHLHSYPVYCTPEAVLPAWALARYRGLRRELPAAAAV
jgi:glycosyltransferase involved in cell wall biosynthesis